MRLNIYKMKYIYSIYLLMLLPSMFSYADSNLYSKDAITYNQATVVKNVKKYLKRIFDDSKKTLKNYYYYEGWHSGLEEKVEDLNCENQFGGIQSNSCKKWLSKRHNTPDITESVYYEYLKHKLSINPETIKIISIKPSNRVIGDQKPYEIVVRAESYSNNVYTLVLEHAKNTRIATAGLLSIVKINGKYIWEVIGP